MRGVRDWRGIFRAATLLSMAIFLFTAVTHADPAGELPRREPARLEAADAVLPGTPVRIERDNRRARPQPMPRPGARELPRVAPIEIEAVIVETPVRIDPGSLPGRRARPLPMPPPGGERPAVPEMRPAAVELAMLAGAQDRFALELFRKAREEEKPGDNILVSPYSIHTAFLMALEGSGGETREQMAKLLGVDGLEADEISRLAGEMRKLLEASEEITLETANALFLRRGIPFRPGFVESVGRSFEAEISPMPAMTDPINAWVSEKTREKIPGILPPGEKIREEMIAFLLNAVYFYGNWGEEFDADKTADDIFTNRDGKEKKVRMMDAQRRFHYRESDGLQALALPYRDPNFRMLLVLPAPGALDDFEASLDLDAIGEIRRGMRSREVRLQVPRFKIEYETVLNEALKKAGMELAFDDEKADFSRMVDLEKLGENVYISEVRHKAFIEVDEEGTEAAAVTSIGFARTTSVMRPEPIPLMRLDRPFYFLIEEVATGGILFLGRAADI